MTEPQQTLRDRGADAFRQGRAEEAVQLLRQAVAADPRDYRAYSVLGAAHLQRREFDEAVSAFEAARRIRPDAANIHYNLGLAYQRAGKPQESIAAFEAAIEVDPSYDKAKEALDRVRMSEARRAAPPQPQPKPDAAEAKAPAAAPSQQQPPAPSQLRMPTAPPAQQAGVPWQAAAPGAPRPADTGLRRLGGDPAPEAGAQADATRAPWQDGAGQEGLGPRPPVGGPAAEQAKTKKEAPTQAEYMRAGFKIGSRYGMIYLVFVALFDRYIQANYGLIAKTPVQNFLPILIGAAVIGILYGGMVGAVTASAKSANAGLAASIGVWVVASMIILLPSAGMMDSATFVIGALMGTGYGLIMGWLISNSVMTYVKRM